jgi:hypothetical protein
MNRISSSSMQVAIHISQSARPREPHDWPLRLCRDARHCSTQQGTSNSRQLLKKESTRPHHTQSPFCNNSPKSTRHQPRRYLNPRHHAFTISHILQHADCSSSHLCERLPPKPSRRRRAASYTRNSSHQHQHSTNRRNVQRTDIDQPPSSAV